MAGNDPDGEAPWNRGIDLGARRVDLVGRVQQLEIVQTLAVPAAGLKALATTARKTANIAIDAFDCRKPAPDSDNPQPTPTFRTPQCGEHSLARNHGIWVAWATAGPLPGSPKMEPGSGVLLILRGAGHPAAKIAPQAFVRHLARAPLHRTTRPEGRAGGAQMLRRAGVRGRSIEPSTPDQIDAAAATLVARYRQRGCGLAATAATTARSSGSLLPEL